jgi:hypothetical protein
LGNLLEGLKRFGPLLWIVALLGSALVSSPVQTASAESSYMLAFSDSANMGGSYWYPNVGKSLRWECDATCITTMGGPQWLSRIDSLDLAAGYSVELYSGDTFTGYMGTANRKTNVPGNQMRSFIFVTGTCDSCPPWVP